MIYMDFYDYMELMNFKLKDNSYINEYKGVKHFVQYDNNDFIFVFLKNYKEVKLPTKYRTIEYHHGDRLIHFNTIDELKLYFDSFFVEVIRIRKLESL